ncbi:unnamed protein product [Symbiodinium natans]|uniref:Uncharacterized protein n=1 Tax=Symbiodinium natans TaxID=878477 RepID=A0A812UA51_9DINO|nr:unnamed protein product [Symbiodinium natans]
MSKGELQCGVNLASAIHIFRGWEHRRSARVLAALGLLLLAFVLRSIRRRVLRLAGGQVNSKGRSTLLTALRLSGRSLQHDQVVDAVLKPLESIVIRDAPTSVVHDHVVFRVGDVVKHCCGQTGTVMGIDEDGDLRVIKADNTHAVWFGCKCTKTFSIGDRVSYACGDVAELVGFDEDGDLIVRRANGSESVWFRGSSTRLLSIGDRVHYSCGQVATVQGFDEEGDVEVIKPDGVKGVWYAHKCIQGLGPLDKALPSEGP